MILELSDSDILYIAAAYRVQRTPELAAYEDFIMANWNEGDEHWEWVINAPVADIIEWVTNTPVALLIGL